MERHSYQSVMDINLSIEFEDQTQVYNLNPYPELVPGEQVQVIMDPPEYTSDEEGTVSDQNGNEATCQLVSLDQVCFHPLTQDYNPVQLDQSHTESTGSLEVYSCEAGALVCTSQTGGPELPQAHFIWNTPCYEQQLQLYYYGQVAPVNLPTTEPESEQVPVGLIMFN